MRVKDLKTIIEKEIEKRELEIKEKKTNINSNYTLAKLDFTVIDNIEDNLRTYKKIIEELDKLQERIIQRNRAS